METPLHQMLQQTVTRQLLAGDEIKIGLLELFFWNDFLKQRGGRRYEYGCVLFHQFVKPFETGRHIIRMGR